MRQTKIGVMGLELRWKGILGQLQRSLNIGANYAIDGRGAFRRFRNALNYHGIENDWYDYKFEALCRIAREWCEFHKIQYT
jgi:hypothetical protein